MGHRISCVLSHSIIISAKLDVSVAFFASKTSPVSQWSEAKMRLKKGGEFPLQKNLSIWECLQISLWKELLSLGYYYHYHCYCYYSHMVVITIINIIIVLSLLLSLSALSLLLFPPGYYTPHLSIQLCGCQPPKRKWKYEENEEKKPLKKTIMYLSDDCQLEELGEVVDDGKGSNGENISSGRPKMRHLWQNI